MVLCCAMMWGCASEDGSGNATGSVAQSSSRRAAELDAGTVDPVGPATDDAGAADPIDDASGRTATTDAESGPAVPDGDEGDTTGEPVSAK